MSNDRLLICPACNGHNFLIKYEATYVYSYNIDSDAPGLKNTVEFLPFLFDSREQKQSSQYLECKTCGTQYPCYFNEWDKEIRTEDLQNAIKNPAVN